MNAKVQPDMAKNEDIAKVEGALVKFSKVDAGIAALRTKYGTVVYDASTAKGLEVAREARAAVREPRYEIERIRKDAKAPILALGKTLDAEAKRITDAILQIEAPIDAVITAEEQRKEREKQERIAAEAKRVADIQERIREFGGAINAAAHSNAALIQEHINDLEKIPVDDSFAEFQPAANAAKAGALTELRVMHAKAKAREEEAERLRLERIELDRLRAEQQERDRIAREATERQAAANREEEKRLADARYRQQAEFDEQRRQQETAAAAERKRLADQEGVQQLERARIAEEQADIERQREALAAAQAAPPTEHVNAEPPTAEVILGTNATIFAVDERVVLEWFQQIDWRAIELP